MDPLPIVEMIVTLNALRDMPIFDLKDMTSNDPAKRRQLADDIRDACKRIGFFYVKIYGIPESTTQAAFEMAKKFFALPVETKMEVENYKPLNFKGYIPFLSANINSYGTGYRLEGFLFGGQDLPDINPIATGPQADLDIYGIDAMAGTNLWPDEAEIPGFCEVVMQYYQEVVRWMIVPLVLARTPSEFHKDYIWLPAASLTFEQLGGVQLLQVLNSENQWIDAPLIPGTFVINIGDQLAYWTNDVFKSTVHRVINRSGVRRYSIPLFFGVDYSVKLEPMPSCASPEKPSTHKVITSEEYIKSRLEAVYKH